MESGGGEYPAVGVHERVGLRIERVPLKVDAESGLVVGVGVHPQYAPGVGGWV